MFVSDLNLKKLKERMNINQSNYERIILHEENSQDTQLM